MSRSDPSPSGQDDVPSSAEERGKSVVLDGYKTSSDVDLEEVRIISEGFTWVEVRLEGSTRTIIIPLDRYLLVDTKNVIPSLGPLCFNAEGRHL